MMTRVTTFFLVVFLSSAGSPYGAASEELTVLPTQQRLTIRNALICQEQYQLERIIEAHYEYPTISHALLSQYRHSWYRSESGPACSLGNVQGEILGRTAEYRDVTWRDGFVRHGYIIHVVTSFGASYYVLSDVDAQYLHM